MGTAKRQKRPAQLRRSFSARARRAAALAAQGHSRKEIAVLIGVAPETISVWKRHPQWQLEIERCARWPRHRTSGGKRACSSSRSRRRAKRSSNCAC